MLNNKGPAAPLLRECTLLENKCLSPGYHLLTFYGPLMAAFAKPGQFVMVYMPASGGKMLPRPFSIFRVDKEEGELSILLAVRGKGTGLLGKAAPPEKWRLLGPLGNNFPPLQAGSLLVAGGMGIAPIAFLAASTPVPRTLIYGCRSAVDLVCPPGELDLPGLTLLEATDDGSRGASGSAVQLLTEKLPIAGAVFACGPQPMLAAVIELCQAKAVPAWVSLEEKMACGIGACLGCVVSVSGGYKRVCRDGPVFPAGEVCLV